MRLIRHDVALYHWLVIDLSDDFLVKAEESLAGAESELAHGRYNNCANRCYYAVFQAAVHALAQAGIRPPGGSTHWDHGFVQAQFVGLLINRRKVFPTSLRDTLLQNYRLREAADYKRERISDVRASRAVRRAQEFVNAVRQSSRG
jgi:uncharacterized protein (UPF0332 family)